MGKAQLGRPKSSSQCDKTRRSNRDCVNAIGIANGMQEAQHGQQHGEGPKSFTRAGNSLDIFFPSLCVSFFGQHVLISVFPRIPSVYGPKNSNDHFYTLFLGFSHFLLIRPALSFWQLFPLTFHIYYPFSFAPCFTLYSFPCSSSANSPKTSRGEDPSRTIIALYEQIFPWFYSVVTQVLGFIFKLLLPASLQTLTDVFSQSDILPPSSSYSRNPSSILIHNLSGLNPPDIHPGKVYSPRTNRLTANLQDNVFAFRLHASLTGMVPSNKRRPFTFCADLLPSCLSRLIAWMNLVTEALLPQKIKRGETCLKICQGRMRHVDIFQLHIRQSNKIRRSLKLLHRSLNGLAFHLKIFIPIGTAIP